MSNQAWQSCAPLNSSCTVVFTFGVGEATASQATEAANLLTSLPTQQEVVLFGAAAPSPPNTTKMTSAAASPATASKRLHTKRQLAFHTALHVHKAVSANAHRARLPPPAQGSMNSATVTEILSAAPVTMTNLTILPNTGLSSIEPEAFKTATSVAALSLNGNPLGAAVTSSLLATVPALAELSLSDTGLTTPS